MNGLSILSGHQIGGANGSHFKIRNVADYSADGKMDLLWQNTLTGGSVIFQMDSNRIVYADALSGAHNSASHLGSGWLNI